MSATYALPAPAVIPRPRVGLPDAVMVATLLAWSFHVVQVPPIPLSPLVYMPFAMLAACRAEWRATRGALLREPALLWTLAALALHVALMFVVRGIGYGEIAEAGRYVAGMVLLVTLAAYTASDPARCRRALVTVVLASTASVAWFLVELGVPGAPLVEWRVAMYADIYAAQDESIVETVRSGLAPYRHLLGYPLTAVVPLLLVPLLRTGTAASRVVPAAGLAVASAGLVLSLQRSALAGALVGAVVLLAGLRSGRALGRAVLVLAAAAAAAVALTRAVPAMAEVMQGTLLEKLQSREGGSDTVFRLHLQARAVELLVQHPLGLPAADLSWTDVGFRHTYERMRAVAEYEHAFAVHNGYLAPALNYGVGLLVVTLGALAATGAAVLRAVRHDPRDDPAVRAWGVGAAGSVAGLYSFQAGMHNASIMSLEPVTLASLGCLVGFVARRRLRVRAVYPEGAA